MAARPRRGYIYSSSKNAGPNIRCYCWMWSSYFCGANKYACEEIPWAHEKIVLTTLLNCRSIWSAGNLHLPNLPPIVSFSLLKETWDSDFHLWEKVLHRIELFRNFWKMEHVKLIKKSRLILEEIIEHVYFRFHFFKNIFHVKLMYEFFLKQRLMYRERIFLSHDPQTKFDMRHISFKVWWSVVWELSSAK